MVCEDMEKNLIITKMLMCLTKKYAKLLFFHLFQSLIKFVCQINEIGTVLLISVKHMARSHLYG